MALIKCSECGKEISNKANICPNCGNPIQKKKTIMLIIIMLLCSGGILVLFSFGKNNEEEKDNDAKKNEVVEDANGNTISVKDFVGTWEVQGTNEITLLSGESFKIEDFIIREMRPACSCLGICPFDSEFYYNVDNRLYSNIHVSPDDFCVQLVDKNTLKQVSCDVLKNECFSDGIDKRKPRTTKNFNIIFKKKSNDIDESLSKNEIFAS